MLRNVDPFKLSLFGAIAMTLVPTSSSLGRAAARVSKTKQTAEPNETLIKAEGSHSKTSLGLCLR
jgi:hypothetical protein